MANEIAARRKYHLDQSPLFRLRNKNKLCDALDCNSNTLFKLTTSPLKYYDIFEIKNKNNNKARIVESPKFKLRQLHKRLFELLKRIEYPDYLHSGVKGRSNLTNAKVHQYSNELLKIDIEKFYPNTNKKHVKNLFIRKFECEVDIARLISDLCTIISTTSRDAHLPTGSPVSQILAFLCHQPMFDNLYQYSIENNLVMTCYVDDICFSGHKMPKNFKEVVYQEIKKQGLKPNYKKTKFYQTGNPKNVTGIVIKDGKLKACNKSHYSIYTKLQNLGPTLSKDAYQKQLSSLMGSIQYAKIIDPNLFKKQKNYVIANMNKTKNINQSNSTI